MKNLHDLIVATTPTTDSAMTTRERAMAVTVDVLKVVLVAADPTSAFDRIVATVEFALREEREACAAIADAHGSDVTDEDDASLELRTAAAAIRARP